ncbi:MAG: P-loop NTPase [Halobacteriales archaeon]
MEAEELREELKAVVDPTFDENVVDFGLVEDVEIDGDVAYVRLAFNAPYSPEETEMGEEIAELISDLGLEPRLEARADIKENDPLPNVKNVVAVASGKGGVGKTTVASNVAVGLSMMGARVGIMDCDIYGPNVPKSLDVDVEPEVLDHGDFLPGEADGVKVISMSLLIPREEDPAVLRGPMIDKFVDEFVGSVRWGELDYLVVDLPPGTGDAALSLVQKIPLTGAMIVTTAQEMSLVDAHKSLRMFRQHDTPILGIVENMSEYVCPNCEDVHPIYGDEEDEGGWGVAKEHGVPLLAEIPMDPRVNRSDVPAVEMEDSPVADKFRQLAPVVAKRVGDINRYLVNQEMKLVAGSMLEEAEMPHEHENTEEFDEDELVNDDLELRTV